MSTESPFPNSDGSDADGAAVASETVVDEVFSDEDGVLYDDEVTPEFGILGFTLRELLIVGAWLVAFVASFFPHIAETSLWGTGIQWILPIGVPTVAVFLLVLRRFSPEGIRRVGSLGIDQFASVAFSVAAVYWLGALWNAVAFAIEFEAFGLNWNGIVQLVAMLALVVLTVFAPLVPGIKEDFHGRLVTLAHRNANPVRPVIARPRPEPATSDGHIPAATGESPSPALEHAVDPVSTSHEDEAAAHASAPASYPTVVPASGLDVELSGQQATDEVARLDLADQVPLASHASGGGTGTDPAPSPDEEYTPVYSRQSWGQEPEIVSDTGSIESLMGARAQDVSSPETTAFPAVDDLTDIDATNPRDAAPTPQPFWILAPTERDVHDERGDAIFRVGPNAWALVIEDRGGAYVVRHDDGRIGYLHDIADITKG